MSCKTDLSEYTQDQYEIPREPLKMVNKLGSGQLGEVWKGGFYGSNLTKWGTAILYQRKFSQKYTFARQTYERFFERILRK